MNRSQIMPRYWVHTLALIAALVSAVNAPAAIVNVNPDNVNYVYSYPSAPSAQNTTYQDAFSTYIASNISFYQRSLVLLSNTSLQSNLGPADSYTINAATLTVGSAADPYQPTNPDPSVVTAHLLLQSYNPAQVTWNSNATGSAWSTPGLGSGTDYNAANAASGVAFGADQTTFDLTAVVQGWLDNTIVNRGLFFLAPPVFHNSGLDVTDDQYVVFTIDYTANFIPEPSTTLLLATGGLILWRRRSSRQ